MKPGVTLDIPANGLDRSLSGAQNELRSDERIGSFFSAPPHSFIHSFIKKRTREALRGCPGPELLAGCSLKSERVKRCAAAPALNCWLVVRWFDALRLVVSVQG